MRVDELLTSEVFGLSSTIDPEFEQHFDRYYDLLASRARGPEAEQELAALEAELAQHQHVGTTRRERLALKSPTSTSPRRARWPTSQSAANC